MRYRGFNGVRVVGVCCLFTLYDVRGKASWWKLLVDGSWKKVRNLKSEVALHAGGGWANVIVDLLEFT